MNQLLRQLDEARQEAEKRKDWKGIREIDAAIDYLLNRDYPTS